MPVSEPFSLKVGDGLEVSFSGAGSVIVDEIIVFTDADGLWTREFAGGYVAVNPTNQSLSVEIAGQTYAIPSKDALFVYYE
jgi:hypothetical protein